ncbi:MAG: Gfo/Idh/MocA family oxidoreductase [Candidatus Omnitrophica bacterium]|nr:Gfo/Idh/MocA family oxidoreductase [Candidatus Omnitrophota bacterium]
MQSPIRLGLVGCGRIAQTHLEAIAKVARVQLTAVYDLDGEQARATAQKYPTTVKSDADAIFEDSSVDAVLICTPPVTHYDYMCRAIARKKHVLCEKPFTLKLEDALDIRERAAKAGVVVMMASKFRFVRDMIEARKAILSGAIGDTVLCEVIFCSAVPMHDRWNSDPAVSGGGVLIDNGSHAVDVIRYISGPIRSLYAQKGLQTQKMKVEDTARLHFETERGVIGMVDLSWSLFKHTSSYVNVMGTRGTIEIGWDKSIIWDSQKKTSKVFGNGYSKLDAFTQQIEHFADCLLKQQSPILGIDDAVESVRVIESAYTSIREQRWLKVAEEQHSPA